MTALFFTSLIKPDHATGYNHRGEYQGRIAPSGNPSGGFHVLVGSGDRRETVADWFPTMDEAKHGLVLAYGAAT